MKKALLTGLIVLSSAVSAYSKDIVIESTVSDIFTFDLMPSSDKSSLQAALFWGMKAFHEIGGGDTGLTIEAIGDTIFTMQQEGVQLSCMTDGTSFACGFSMDKADRNANPNILDIGTTDKDDSIQSALVQFVFVYMTVFGPEGDLKIEATRDSAEDPIVFTTSTAKLTSNLVESEDGVSLVYSMNIELL